MSSKEILIIGGSYAGLNSAHFFLKKVLPTLPNPQSYKVHVVSPSTHFYPRPGAPRALMGEEFTPIDKLFLPIEDGFKNYPKESFSFTQGTATSMDGSARTVTVTLADGQSKVLEYYALIIASGTSPSSPLFGLQGVHSISVEAIEEFRKALPNFKNVIVAGGGPVGVETSGELGHKLNGEPGWFASRPKEVKTHITIITSDKKLLPSLRPALATRAEKLLARLGVDVVYNTRIESVSPEGAGTLDEKGGLSRLLAGPVKVTLSNGETRECDLFVPAMGVKPNSNWLPTDLLNERGYVEANPSSLRVDKAGPRVYVVGDVGSHSHGGVLNIFDAVPVVMHNIKQDLIGYAAADAAQDASANGSEKLPVTASVTAAPGKDREFKPNHKETQLVPVGRSKGVGAFSGWKIPSFMVWLIKGRDFMIGMYPDAVTGKKW